jgi:hypothetical protein
MNDQEWLRRSIENAHAEIGMERQHQAWLDEDSDVTAMRILRGWVNLARENDERACLAESRYDRLRKASFFMVTATESSGNREQSSNIISLMGENLEDGSLYAIKAAYETVRINITYRELASWMGREVADKYRDPDRNSKTGLRLPDLSSGSFKVSGVSTLLRNQEVVSSIAQLILPLLDQSKYGNLFAPYIKNYKLLRAIELRLNLQDEGIIVPDADAKRIDKQQQQQQEAAIQAQQAKESGEAAMAHAGAAHKHGEAEKSMGEADANRAQAELFAAQAGAVQPPEAAGYGGEV